MRVKIFSSFLLFCLLPASLVFADELSDSNRFFDFAEENYPQFFSPADQDTVEFQGYLVRYYADTNIYLATQDSGVFVYRPDQGSGIVFLGGIFNFISEDSGSEEPGAGDEGPIAPHTLDLEGLPLRIAGQGHARAPRKVPDLGLQAAADFERNGSRQATDCPRHRQNDQVRD